MISNLVHVSKLFVKYFGQIMKKIRYELNLSRFKEHLSSISIIALTHRSLYRPTLFFSAENKSFK